MVEYKNINLYIKHIESNKTKRIIISRDRSIRYLKKKIIKKLNLDTNDIQLKYSSVTYKNKTKIIDTTIPDKATIFISTSKLKGGDIGLAYGLITVPNTALMINLIFMVIVCPIQYFFLMYGSSSKAKVLKMKYSSSFFSNFNNFKLREIYDDKAKKELERDEFPNFKYSILKSKLYMIYSLLYISFISFFSNLFPLSSFIDHYGKIGSGTRTSKCFIYTNTPSIIGIGLVVMLVVPGIIYVLNFFGFQFGLITYLITLAFSSACLYTSVYYYPYQQLDKAIDFRDPLVPEDTYKGEAGKDINFMPSYFWALFISPGICIVVILVLYLFDVKHSIIWGLICSFACINPLVYLMSKQMSLYCIQYPFCNRSSDTLNEIISKNNYSVDTANEEDLSYKVKTSFINNL